jgi:hypothetical protein
VSCDFDEVEKILASWVCNEYGTFFLVLFMKLNYRVALCEEVVLSVRCLTGRSCDCHHLTAKALSCSFHDDDYSGVSSLGF